MRFNSRFRRDSQGRFAGLSARMLARLARYQAGMDFRAAQQMERLEQRLRTNVIYSLKGAAYEVTQRAKASIIRTKGGKRGAGRPGGPPTTRGLPQKSLKAAIWYAVEKEKQDAIIGPRFSFVADVGRLHEFGGKRRGKRGTATYPKRPFMAAALAKTLPKIPTKFRSLLSE